MNKIYFEDIAVGDEIPVLVKKPVTETQLVQYAGASGDFNPIHTVHAMGKWAGFDGVIAHGMLIMAFVAEALTNWLPDSSLKKYKTRFASVTKPKDVITVKGKVLEKKDSNIIACEVKAVDQNEDVKLIGYFEAVLPSKA